MTDSLALDLQGLKVAKLLPAATQELEPFQDKDFQKNFQIV